MKILGVYFTYNVWLKKDLNFDAMLKSLKKTFNSWQWRNLTIWGRIQTIKNFAMHRASLFNLDKTLMKNVNSLMFDFVWKGKDKRKRLALIGGGLKMSHIESAVKAQRIMCVKKIS